MTAGSPAEGNVPGSAPGPGPGPGGGHGLGTGADPGAGHGSAYAHAQPPDPTGQPGPASPAGPATPPGPDAPEPLDVRDLPASRTEPDGSAVIRLLSYNIRSLRDSREALIRVIRACAPDLVFIQEAPRFFRWRKKTSWLARDCGLVVVTGGATASGPLLMSSLRARVIRTEDVLLPRTPGLHRRGFATAALGFGGAEVSVASFHLSLNAEERYEQAGALLRRFPDAGTRHVVVAGDVNERPDGRTWRRLSGVLTDAHAAVPWGGTFTSTAHGPYQRIDGVFTSPSVEVLGCGVPEGLPGITEADMAAATDHRPVLAALRLRA